MIFVETKLKVTDNVGVSIVKCIKILARRRVGFVGGLILVVVAKLAKVVRKTKKRIKKATFFVGLIATTRTRITRPSGFTLRFFSNRVLLLNKQNKFLGTRIKGGLAKETVIPFSKKRAVKRQFQKVLSLATFLI